MREVGSKKLEKVKMSLASPETGIVESQRRDEIAAYAALFWSSCF